MIVKVKKLSANAVIPLYMKKGDSGFDLTCTKDITIVPGESGKVPLGLAFEVPEGYELQIRPRSGITSKTKLRVQFGTIDSGYRGEVFATVDNIGTEASRVTKGTRIAQGVIAPVIRVLLTQADELSQTERGENGFGHTGTN